MEPIKRLREEYRQLDGPTQDALIGRVEELEAGVERKDEVIELLVRGYRHLLTALSENNQEAEQHGE